MRRFRIGQPQAGRLLSCLVSGLRRPAAPNKEVTASRLSSSCGITEADGLPIPGPKFRSESPEAALRSVQRLWPSRFY
jgi:hypothetical protein